MHKYENTYIQYNALSNLELLAFYWSTFINACK